MNVTEVIEEFERKFHDEESCASFLYSLKWPNGFQCHACGHAYAYTIVSRRQPLYECMNCSKQTTITANTIMHKSKTPLKKWLLSLYIVSLCERGINAVQLKRLISVTYKTAWDMLHKIRLLISEWDQSVQLEGEVEGKHEVYMRQIFPTESNLEKERSVVVASAEHAKQPYVKMKLLSRKHQARDVLSEEEQSQFIEEHTAADLKSLILNPRTQRKYIHKSMYMKSDEGNSTTIENGSQSEQTYPFSKTQNQQHLSDLASSAFSWLNDVFHGLGLKYAQHYLNEFCFRINGINKSTTNSFELLAIGAVSKW